MSDGDFRWSPDAAVCVVMASGGYPGAFEAGKIISGIDDADYLIAATALLLEADLLTTNVCHFPMLPGLQSPY